MTDLALDQAFSLGMGETQVRFPTTLDRLIHLRSLPNLGGLASMGMTYVAHQAIERHFEPGELVYRPEEPVDSIHFLVEGQIRVEQEGLHLLTAVPPFGIGFLPVLASSDVGQKATALEPTVTLQISRADLLEIFEDDFGFLETGIRQLSRQCAEAQRELEARGLLTRSDPVDVPYPHETLDLVERLELTRFGPYAEVNLEPLVHIVRQATELRLEPGDVLWEEGEHLGWGIHIAYGVVHCTAEDRSFLMGPGSAVGFAEANGGAPRSYRAVAKTKVVALKETSDVFFDVLEDNFALAIGLMKFLSAMLLRISVELARARRPEEEA